MALIDLLQKVESDLAAEGMSADQIRSFASKWAVHPLCPGCFISITGLLREQPLATVGRHLVRPRCKEVAS